MDTDSQRTLIEVTPTPLLAVDLLHSFLTPAVDLVHNSAVIALLYFGLSMGDELGLEAALYNARNIAKAYAITSCCNCALNGAFTKFTILHGNLSVISAGLAGCCTGVLRNISSGSPDTNLSSCYVLGIPGLVDYVVNSRHFFVSKIPKSILNFQRNIVHSGLVDKAFKFILIAGSVGSAIAHGVDLELWKVAAPDVLEFSAIAFSLLASSSLLLFEKQHNKNVLSAGAIGCWITLLFPRQFDGPKDVLHHCFQKGLFCESLITMYSRGSYFLRLPRVQISKVYREDVLPPFTLLLPNKYEEGFGIFYEALKKSIKKS